MNYLIREMLPDDWPMVSQIYQEAIDVGKSTFRRECPTYATWDNSHLSKCRFVMVVDNKVVGWCVLSPTSLVEAYQGVVEVSIYFAKDYQSKGLGTKLMNYLIIESEKNNYWCLYAAIFSINEASINLHEKCGFRIIGHRQKIARDRWDNWQDTTLLERRSTVIL